MVPAGRSLVIMVFHGIVSRVALARPCCLCRSLCDVGRGTDWLVSLRLFFSSVLLSSLPSFARRLASEIFKKLVFEYRVM